MSKNDTLYMKRPASWPMELGREAIPLGNGKTGVLVPGGVGDEEIIFNRYDLWNWAEHNELPDLDGALKKMRDYIDAGDYDSANDYMYNQLRERGYTSEPGTPMMLGSLKIHFETESLFTHYRRILRMEQGECEVNYHQKSRFVKRNCFVSRHDDVFYYEYSANEDTDVTISFDVFDDRTSNYKKVCEDIKDGLTHVCVDNGIDFLVKTDSLEYGAKIRVFGADVTVEGAILKLTGKHFRIAVRCGTGQDSTLQLEAPVDFDYSKKLEEHAALHSQLYHSADIRLTEGENRFNEDLLDEAYETEASLELIEKMWRFGRYLFISGTCEDGLPFPLYGLWHTKYAAMWSQHVANENVEIIYWHTNVGGFAKLVRPLIDYYASAIEVFKENAKKLYGCSGIFVGGYTSPANKHLSIFVPVILNFTGVAGWLSQHFYKYYVMTGDRETLDAKIFPFMLESANFYLDYIQYNEKGEIVYYPCVSPENTPPNLLIPGKVYAGHQNPVTKNAVMEIAIVKELFKNLIALIKETGEHTEYLERLEKALADMPNYLINSDGALKEWATEELDDNYAHRHVSHIFPLFPGEEISKEDDECIYKAIERAVDLRKLGRQSGWSLAHIASIYATLGQAEKTLECLDILLKGCTLNNFVTLHNDWRNMGVALTWVDVPVQMDANMGFVNAVQKMLFDERNGYLSLLPALPERLAKGNVRRLHFSKGYVSMDWDIRNRKFEVKVCFNRDGQVKIRLPEGFQVADIGTTEETYDITENVLILQGKKDSVFNITCK